MNKKNVLFVILSSLILGGLGGWILIRFALPWLHTNTFLRKYHLSPAAAPLVINTKQEIRYYDGTDSIAAIQKAEPWSVGIITGADPAHAQLSGGGVVLTSDGLIATAKSVVPDPSKIYVKFIDGAVLQAQLKAQDPASDLVLIKVNGNNLATAGLGYSRDLQQGQRMIVISPTLDDGQTTSVISYISSEIRNFPAATVLSSEQINATFGVDALTNILDGTMIISTDSNVLGIYSRNMPITSDTIRSALNSYFNTGAIVRSNLGIHYQFIPKAIATLYNSTEGVLVKRPDPKTLAVAAGSPAATAGIAEGDVIYKIDGTQIDADNSFEDLISRAGTGKPVTMSIMRGGISKDVSVILLPR